ncbi:MAG: YggT family protein [Desulfitobacterium hafniense]|nr:YggT family protein [Desulfitobacterium hafniense]
MKQNQENSMTRKIIYYILGFLEVLFVFRLIFKILGANPQSTFVAMIYSITKLFIAPFIGIFRMAVSKGIETQSVLEPTLIIAMIVYALLAWGIVKLINISSNQKDSGTC